MMAKWTNEQLDKRYENFLGTEEDKIFGKIANPAEQIRKTDLDDIKKYIDNLHNLIEHREAMLEKVYNGGRLYNLSLETPTLEQGYSGMGFGKWGTDINPSGYHVIFRTEEK